MLKALTVIILTVGIGAVVILGIAAYLILRVERTGRDGL